MMPGSGRWKRKGEGMSVYFVLLYFFVYGFLGWCTEVAFAGVKEGKFVNRGLLNGPICPIYGVGVAVVVSCLDGFKDNLVLLYISSVVLVTALEWFTGFVLDKLFHNKWWDYSSMPLNLNGYVCLLFSLIWGVACVLIVKVLHPLIHKGLDFLPEFVGWTCIVLFGVTLFVDLYVTVTDILKMNKKLAKMNEIATELHRISDEIGENIYEDVKEALEFKEEMTGRLKERAAEFQERRKDLSEDVREQIMELSKYYRELVLKNPAHMKRIIKAFPKLESRKYKDALEDLREYIWKNGKKK